jgi:hypothetical protein
MMFPNVDTKTLNSISDISSSTRKDCKSEVPNLSTSISTRVAVQTAELIDDGFTLEEAAEVTMYPFFDGTGGVNSERVFVKQLVQKHLGDVNTDPFNTANQTTKENPF